MGEAEKEAIDKIKEVIRYDKEHRIVTIYDEKPLFRDILQTTLDYIDKLQKENEGLKADYQVLEDDLKDHRIAYIDTPKFEEKFISKDKIREQIKELEVKREKSGSNIFSYGIYFLNELLREN